MPRERSSNVIDFSDTLRLDADVIAWLRKQGKGYQTHALLRAAMLRDLQQKAG